MSKTYSTRYSLTRQYDSVVVRIPRGMGSENRIVNVYNLDGEPRINSIQLTDLQSDDGTFEYWYWRDWKL